MCQHLIMCRCLLWCLLGQLRDTGCASSLYLCIGEDIGRDNLIRPKGLSGVDKGC